MCDAALLMTAPLGAGWTYGGRMQPATAATQATIATTLVISGKSFERPLMSLLHFHLAITWRRGCLQ